MVDVGRTDAVRRAAAEDAVRAAGDEPVPELVDEQEPAAPPPHAPPRPARRRGAGRGGMERCGGGAGRYDR